MSQQTFDFELNGQPVSQEIEADTPLFPAH